MGNSHKHRYAVSGIRGSVVVFGTVLIATLASSMAGSNATTHGFAGKGGHVSALQVDMLSEPLGLDDTQPMFSWKIQDSGQGARQSAYRIRVSPTVTMDDAGLLWDSGKIESGDSIQIRYGGKELEPYHRYFWSIETWDKNGNAYPASGVSHWDTGVMNTDSWKSQWIGYEQPEDKSIRESNAQWITNVAPPPTVVVSGDSHHDFRFHLDLNSPIARAELLITGEDTAGAWVNGKLVLEEASLPAWKQTPWQSYVRKDITPHVRQGSNLIAIEVKRFAVPNPSVGGEVNVQSPMSACIYVVKQDGSSEMFISDTTHWKAMVNAPTGWERPDFVDGEWKDAIAYVPPSSPLGTTVLGNPWPTGPVELLRKSFAVSTKLRSAKLYVTALGAYVMHINGKRVGDQILAPGWTDYREHVTYQTFDVTNLVRSGDNAIGAYLAPAWYSGPLMWFQQPFNYGKTPPALRAELRIELSNGEVRQILTDSTWKAHGSEIEQAEIYNGERTDTRKAIAGWDTASLNDANWGAVEVIEPAAVHVVAQDFEPIRVEQTLTAKSVSEASPGVYIFDFGQNLAGIERVHTTGHSGQEIKLRFAEVLNADGSLYTENLRTAKATDSFTLSGKGSEVLQPQFTFHGFRYAELTGVRAKPAIDTVQAVVFHTDAAFTTKLNTGDPTLNKLWSNILWGQRSNFIGLPTDCPQRDERLGWSADAQVFWRTASYNMALGPFSRKFSRDLRGTQVGTPMYGIFAPGVQTSNPGFGMGWSDAGVIIPWTDWLQQGDMQAAAQNWEAMDRYMGAIEKANPDFLWKNQIGIPFGDWLAPAGRAAIDLVATTYWAYDTELMRQLAHALKNDTAEKKYEELHANIKQAFIKTYTREDGYVGGGNLAPSPFAASVDKDSDRTLAETQTGYVLALYMNLVPEQSRQAAGDRLAAMIKDNGGRLATGFLGTPYLLAALTDTGHADVAYSLLLSTKYPSWGYLVEHGATTTWERWNGDQMRGDPSMNSYNHYAYGAVADWIYRYAAGVDAMPEDPGFHTILLHPHFDARLKNLSFEYETPYGTAKSSWQVSGATVHWQVTIPANAQAELKLGSAQEKAIKLDGSSLEESRRIKRSPDSHGVDTLWLAAGTYSFDGMLAHD